MAKFDKGNTYSKGRSVGSRNKTTIALEESFDVDADKMISLIKEKALSGDVSCLKLWLDRVLPPRKERVRSYNMLPVASEDDIVPSERDILNALGKGEVTISEAESLFSMLHKHMDTVIKYDHGKKVLEIEEKTKEMQRKGMI